MLKKLKSIKFFAAACLALSLSTAVMAPAAQAARLSGCYFLWGEGDEPVGYMCCQSGACDIHWF